MTVAYTLYGVGALAFLFPLALVFGSTRYATTIVYYKNEPPLNVALIDLDEGFRMMSRVEGLPAGEVEIGARVRFEVRRGEEDEPVAVFVREEG